MTGKIKEVMQAYHYIQLMREHFESHSWCRRQTQYDSEFITDFSRSLMNMSNKLYELTQLFSQPLTDEGLREKIADLVSIAHCGYHLKYLLKYQAVNLGDDLKVKRIYEITDQILPLIPNEEAIEERGYQRGVRDANKAVEMDAEEARRSIA